MHSPLLALDGLGRDLLRALAGLAVVTLLALAFAVATPLALLTAGPPLPAPGGGARQEEIPRDQLAVMRQVAAGSPCGLTWQLLAAVARVESDFGRLADRVSPAGAYGYGQFMHDTWRAFGGGVPWRSTDPTERDRPPEQRSDSTNYRYALPAMQRYLCALAREATVGQGPANDARRALFFYSHRHDTPYDPADAYVARVLTLAAAYARGATSAAPADGAGAGSARAVELARRYLGVPYLFGGTSPSTGLDCSGLVQLVYRQLGVSLPRTAQQQYESTTRVAVDQLQPGDLVFFARTYPSSEWITHVGIYVGNNQQINAPAEGQVVSIQPVFAGFWGAHYAGAGRARSAS